MSKIIAVVGATGAQGGSVVRVFSKIPGWKVRGITRNPDSPAASQLKDLGVEVIKGDLDDVSSLKAAFTGANAIYGVTDFWQFVQSPSTQSIIQSEGITWNEACYRQELQQGKNVIDAASQVVEEGVLERLVLSSLSDARKASGGKYNWVYHFDGKAHFVQYLKDKAEKNKRHRLLLEKTSYVQMGYYLDNWKKNPIFTPKKNADGAFVFRSIASNSETGIPMHPLPFVHPPTDTGIFVEVLVLKAPPRTTILGTSTVMQYSEYIKLWGEINAVKTELQPMSMDDYVAEWPNGFGLEAGETACYIRDFGWDGGEGALLPEEVGIDKNRLSDVRSYITSTDWSSILD